MAPSLAAESVPYSHMAHMAWRPLERPSSAVNLRPASEAHFQEEQATKLRLLNPLHAGIPTSLDSKIRSVVEALFTVQYQTASSAELGDASPSEDAVPSVELHTVAGIRSYLMSEPSLAWAAPQAARCLKLLRKRAGVNHTQGAGLPSGAHGLAMRRSHSAASRLCGGGRLPPMGGGGALCAASLLHTAPPVASPPTWEAAARLAGIEWETAVALAYRLLGLTSEQHGVAAWLLIETCRDCARHSSCFRHEERSFQKRYAQLRAAISQVFAGPVVESLVPPGTSGRHGPPVRIGAFEVFLCCPEPFVPFGAISLPTAQMAEQCQPCRPADEDADPTCAEVGGAAATAFSAVCISSKLRTLRWPQIDQTLLRLAAAMPRTPLSVRVETAAGLAVANVVVRAAPCHDVFQADLVSDNDPARRTGGSPLTIQGLTDRDGHCRLMVPVCMELQLSACHEFLLDAQERAVVIPGTAAPAEQVFVAETVLQLWQAEGEKDLVIYSFSPRAQMCLAPRTWSRGGAADAAQQEEFAVRSAFAAHPELQLGMRLRPFQGYLEKTSGHILQPDVRGYIRGGPQIFEDVCLVGCDGWRSAKMIAAEPAAGKAVLLEFARLGVPKVEVYILASCCRAPLPKARISIDGEAFGATDSSGSPVLCGVRCGERHVQVQHSLVAEGLTIPVNITDSTTRGVRALMPFSGLHFVCVARNRGAGKSRASTPSHAARRKDLEPLSPSFRKKGESAPKSADLYVVGGSLAKWKGTRGGPASDQEVWLWNGEFRGIVSEEGRGFVVEGGQITGQGPASDYQDEDESGICCLSHALGVPVARNNMQAVLHAASGPQGCAMCLMAQMVDSQTPAMWIARMEDKQEGRGRREFRRQNQSRGDLEKRRRQLVLRTTCCQRGFLGASATIDEKPAEFSDGVIDLPWEGSDTAFRIRLDAIPNCLLPGRSCEYIAHCTQQSPECMDLDISCSLWIYWVPPEAEEDQDDEDWDGELPQGFVWIAANSDHVPEEALPVEGIIDVPGAEEAQIKFDGSTMGPFTLRPVSGSAVLAQDDGKAPCLLAGLKFTAKPPDGYYHREKEPSPFEERILELGGCELPRLVNCPVAIGFYKVVQPPPLRLKLRSSCCRCAYEGAQVVLKGHTSGTIDETGCVELKRRVDRSCSSLHVKIDGVPKCLLRDESEEQEVQCGPFEEASMDLDVSCMIWAYWIPPREDDEEPKFFKEGDGEEKPENAELEALRGKLFIAADVTQVPEEAYPIVGALRCPGSKQPITVLDGNSIGPFRLDEAPDRKLRSPVGGKSHHPCLLAGLTIEVKLFDPGLAYHAIDPPPLAETSRCQLQQLTEGPLVLGNFSLLHPPPLKLSALTACCCRGYTGANITLLQHGKAVAEGPLNENGCGEFQRERDRGCKELQVQVGAVPSCLLPGYKPVQKLKCKPFEEASMELEIASYLWIYWIPPDENEDEDDSPDAAPRQGLLFVTADKEQVPDEAKPAQGVLLCHGAEALQTVVDGSSMGPFSVRPPRRVRDALKRKKTENKMVQFKTEDEMASDEPSWPKCLLAQIEFRMKPPSGYSYTAKEPSPLFERYEEIGGCELQRIAQCPVVVGYFTAITPPPMCLSFCATCCGRGFVGTHVKLQGGQQRAEATVGEDGNVRLKRRRDPDCKKLELQVENIPLCLLPGASRQIAVDCDPFAPVNLSLDIQCLLWVYWTPPEEDDEDVARPPDGEPPMPPDMMLWVASDVEHVPVDAQCVRGTLMCPGAEPAFFALSGITTGPFQLQRAPPPDPREDDFGEDVFFGEERTEEEEKKEEEQKDATPPTCLLASLRLEAEPPEGFSFRPRDPTPFAERTAELGGCEMQRLTQCPQVVGHFAPIPGQPVQISLRTGCCGRGFSGANININGACMPIDDSGVLEVPRKRDPKTQELVKFHVDNVPPCLLPGGYPDQFVSGTVFAPLPAPLEVSCNLWIYWVPPEEDEDEEEPPEALVWIAGKIEDLPEDEALPLSGFLTCPGTEVPYMELDGKSMGPFQIRKAGMSTEVPAEEDAECILPKLALQVVPPEGYTYRPRDPSPFAERCEDLGGCEMQRLVTCPTVFGYLKLLP